MKKALALVMALAMVMSMAAVVMAATDINASAGDTYAVKEEVIEENLYVKRNDSWTTLADDDEVRFGETVYIKLKGTDDEFVTDSDAVKNLNITAKWTKNGSYIKSVELVKAKVGDSFKVYAIAIETTGTSTSDVNVVGEISIKGKSYYYDATADKNFSDTIKTSFDIELDLAYEDLALAAADTELALNDGDEYLVDFEDVEDTEEFTVDFGGKVLVETDVKNMKKVLFAYNEDENEELLDAYVDANLEFFNCTGTFRRTAEVTIEVEEGSYLYEVVDGKLVAVDGEYDDWTEEFTFKTRTMGDYVISDTKLATETVAVTNPTTGAAA